MCTHSTRTTTALLLPPYCSDLRPERAESPFVCDKRVRQCSSSAVRTGRRGRVRVRRTQWGRAWCCVVDDGRARVRAARGDRGRRGTMRRNGGCVVVAAGAAARAAAAAVADGRVRLACRAFGAAVLGVRQVTGVVVVRCGGALAALRRRCRSLAAARCGGARAVVARGEKRGEAQAKRKRSAREAAYLSGAPSHRSCAVVRIAMCLCCRSRHGRRRRRRCRRRRPRRSRRR